MLRVGITHIREAMDEYQSCFRFTLCLQCSLAQVKLQGCSFRVCTFHVFV
jgi:hypothetical protein